MKDSIDSLWKEYAAAVVASDIERWISLWIDKGIQMPPNAPVNIGKEKIKAFTQTLMNGPPVSKMVVNSEEVRETSDWGFSRGNYWFEMTPKEGETVKVIGKFTTIFEKQEDGSWKIARDCFNYDTPL